MFGFGFRVRSGPKRLSAVAVLATACEAGKTDGVFRFESETEPQAWLVIGLGTEVGLEPVKAGNAMRLTRPLQTPFGPGTATPAIVRNLSNSRPSTPAVLRFVGLSDGISWQTKRLRPPRPSITATGPRRASNAALPAFPKRKEPLATYNQMVEDWNPEQLARFSKAPCGVLILGAGNGLTSPAYLFARTRLQAEF